MEAETSVEIQKKSLTKRILKRGAKYSVVGITTYIIDLCLIWLFIQMGMSNVFAVGFAFFLAVTLNYLLSYFWVYRGTERKLSHGYMIFLVLALMASVIIAHSTVWLASFVALSIYLARTIIACIIGIFVFIINTKYNFKLL